MTDKTEAMGQLIAQDAELIEICPDDLVRRLRDGHVCSIAQNSCRNGYAISLAADRIEAQAAEIERLKWALNDAVKTSVENARQRDAARTFDLQKSAEIERLHRALRRYGRHLIGENPCDLYANSTRSCTCGLTDDLKWS